MNERRKEPRVREENKIILEAISGIDAFCQKKVDYALTKDISIGGARILSDTHFPEGTRFKIALTLSRSKQVIDLEGEVKWVKDRPDEGLYEMGVEFIHEISHTVMALIRHIYGKEEGIATTISI